MVNLTKRVFFSNAFCVLQVKTVNDLLIRSAVSYLIFLSTFFFTNFSHNISDIILI